MFARDLTVGDLERLHAAADQAVDTLQMDEETFRAFYDRTARAVWTYIARVTGDRAAADDLLQEAYYRFLRADRRLDDEAHRRNYLFRIVTNLLRDRYRQPRPVAVQVPSDHEAHALVAPHDVARETERRADLARAMAHLKRRERELLWLAYADGCSHEEIAASLGLRKGSVKMLLFRARRRLAALLRQPPQKAER
jgi:RNA polymerase sigma-70 factor (ECF subfamily)